MPKPDGIQALRALRAKNIATPMLLLTAKSQVEDRVAGLDSGAEINVVWAYISYLRRKFVLIAMAFLVGTTGASCRPGPPDRGGHHQSNHQYRGGTGVCGPLPLWRVPE